MDNQQITLSKIASESYNSIFEGVYATDKDRKIIFWSPSAERLTGWKAEEVIGLHCRDNILCHVDLQGRHLCSDSTCPMARSIATQKTSTFPALVFGKSKHGKRIPMTVTVSPLRDDSGQVIGAVEVFRDSSYQYHDLAKSKLIQENSLKNNTPTAGPIQFRTYYSPCNIVGGDFYAIEDLGNNDFCFLQADVMGHGTASALYTMYLRGVWDDLQSLYHDPAQVLKAMNDHLSQLTEQNHHFATGACFFYQHRQSKLIWSGAGHSPAFLFHHDQSVEKLEMSGYPLGLIEDADYELQSCNIIPGDRLFIYTDGLIEVPTAEKRELGEDGLIELLQKMNYPKTPIKFKELEKSILELSPELILSDDVCIIEMAVGETNIDTND